MMYYVDIDCLSNSLGKNAYGGRIDAYSFYETTCEEWFRLFSDEVIASVGIKYLPVYRMADGELRFLFGPKINWKKHTFKSILRYIKDEVFKRPWSTSWGERYKTKDLADLRNVLRKCIFKIAKNGKLAIYWNENGLNAFTEYNNSIMMLFSKINIPLNQKNYVPFHFGQALIANNAKKLIIDRNVLFISGLSDNDFFHLHNNIISFGAKSVTLFKCSSTSTLTQDYTSISLTIIPDIVFVAAGIGAAKIIVDLRHLNCPIIDIGGYIHVLSGKKESVHGGFFARPK